MSTLLEAVAALVLALTAVTAWASGQASIAAGGLIMVAVALATHAVTHLWEGRCRRRRNGSQSRSPSP